jgi:hypothetical protein
MHRPGDRMFANNRRCLPCRKRAYRRLLRRRCRRRWKTFPERPHRNRGILGLTRTRSLAAHGPHCQEVCLFLPQAPGMRMSQSSEFITADYDDNISIKTTSQQFRQKTGFSGESYAVVALRAGTQARSPESAERSAWSSARHPSRFRGCSRRSSCRRGRARLIDFRLLAALI